ncbi:MAG TPA: hypothetical protein DHM90_11035 [Clostridiaceae bacterium]|nr:hypothetical protein [Clostridiaceae bacterium]
MKRKLLVPILAVEAVLCLLFYFMRDTLPNVFTTVFAFPLEQMGLVLRYLSLSGTLGNIIALIVYVLISLSPVMLYRTLQRKKKVFTEDSLLFVLSLLLFAIIYFMVNPGTMSAVFPVNMPGDMAKATLSLTFYVVLMGYGVLKILRQFYDAGLQKITKYLRILLSFLSGYYVLYVFGVIFGSFMKARDTLYAGNSGLGYGISTSESFLFMQYAVMALPYLLNILVVLAIIELLEEMGKDRYSDAAALKAESLTRLCRKTLTVIVLTSMSFHLVQFMFLKNIQSAHTNLEIPFMPLIFILSVLMLNQFVRENKTLKQDNDMFI